MSTQELVETVAEATAEMGMQEIANWLPADRHAELRELLQDLVIGALHAYADGAQGWHEVPPPNLN